MSLYRLLFEVYRKTPPHNKELLANAVQLYTNRRPYPVAPELEVEVRTLQLGMIILNFKQMDELLDLEKDSIVRLAIEDIRSLVSHEERTTNKLIPTTKQSDPDKEKPQSQELPPQPVQPKNTAAAKKSLASVFLVETALTTIIMMCSLEKLKRFKNLEEAIKEFENKDELDLKHSKALQLLAKMVNDKKTSILIEPETADEFFDRFRESSTTKMGRFVLSYPSWMAESLLWDKEEHDIDSEFERLTRQLAALDEKIDQEREKTAHEKELKRKADEEKKRLEEEAKKKEAEAKEKLEKEKAAKKAQEAADKKAKPPADKGAKEPSPDKSKNTDSKKTLNSKEPTKKSAPSTKK